MSYNHSHGDLFCRCGYCTSDKKPIINIKKINKAVKLYCQIQNMIKKLAISTRDFNSEEYNEYQRRIK